MGIFDSRPISLFSLLLLVDGPTKRLCPELKPSPSRGTMKRDLLMSFALVAILLVSGVNSQDATAEPGGGGGQETTTPHQPLEPGRNTEEQPAPATGEPSDPPAPSEQPAAPSEAPESSTLPQESESAPPVSSDEPPVPSNGSAIDFPADIFEAQVIKLEVPVSSVAVGLDTQGIADDLNKGLRKSQMSTQKILDTIHKKMRENGPRARLLSDRPLKKFRRSSSELLDAYDKNGISYLLLTISDTP
ncbi:unnamed protein product [Bursaphelenchus xylophilus]|uniref:(pine wood nematode) hypothetical protein n=1 Tax=Bursaphelenchus xylophilus TaxID=6326 RepID=A0A1I7S7K9_BURXY|nr:unnamed protein product [Bursaphelenchus xylophilus]CAG9111951.1 unnamed protein product [Bursaphelenchus xylophilus]